MELSWENLPTRHLSCLGLKGLNYMQTFQFRGNSIPKTNPNYYYGWSSAQFKWMLIASPICKARGAWARNATAKHVGIFWLDKN